ncbi:glycosyltransferase [Candidatus Woesearchaeota archaeon]|nr:glycosyltransferase [Candidatus Woesearchaeota archaeon]
MKDLTIIIPTLNEEKNIPRVLQACKTYTKNILVVDDDSTDKTRQLAEKAGAKVIHRTKNKGLTASVLDGVQNTKTKYFIVMDGDGQHDITKISKIRELLESHDLVVGVRESVPGWPWHRKLMSKIAENLGKIRLKLTGTNCGDILSGFFGARTEYVQKYLEKYPRCFVLEGYKVLFDILKNSKNLKIEEVNYVFLERKEGKSKIGKKQVIAFLKSAIL